MAHQSKIVLLFAMLLTACTSSTEPMPDQKDLRHQFADEYIIGIGDAVSVSVWRNPDLSVNATVRPDGKITAPIAGDVMVGGKTTEEVSKVIKEALAQYIRDPIVTVSIGSGNADYLTRVRVTGAVNQPSSMSYRQGMTVMDVVLDAGGLTEFANGAKTTLYRSTGEKLTVRMDRILRKGDLSTNYSVLPGDVITVPERLF